MIKYKNCLSCPKDGFGCQGHTTRPVWDRLLRKKDKNFPDIFESQVEYLKDSKYYLWPRK